MHIEGLDSELRLTVSLVMGCCRKYQRRGDTEGDFHTKSFDKALEDVRSVF